MSSSSFQIAVVGAGPAGAATARRLALAGCRVVLLERSTFGTPRVGESLAPAVQPLLAELGVWSAFAALRPLPSYGTRSAWGGDEPEMHAHLTGPYLTGWHVDRRAFDLMLAEHAAAAGAELRLGVRVVRREAAADGGSVLQLCRAGDEKRPLDEVRADFVVDATGRGTATARWFGARHAVFDRLVGIAAELHDGEAGARCFTQVEATVDGWWYAAPIAQGRSMAMLMTDGDLARAGGFVSSPRWRSALLRAPLTAMRVEGCATRWGPRAFSAVSQRLRRDPGRSERWLAVGDAALAVDPISGSGVVRALRTARDAAAAVRSALEGHPDALGAYEDERDRDCTRYLVERADYYAAETRWPGSAFWARRLLARRALEQASVVAGQRLEPA